MKDDDKFLSVFLILVVTIGFGITMQLYNANNQTRLLKQKIEILENKIEKQDIKQHRFQDSLKNQNAFIKSIADIAIDAKEKGILPSILIAQAIVESNYGKSSLTSQSNNLFCIKGSYNGQCVYAQDDEPGLSSFRKYTTINESISDYIELMQSNRYCDLLYDKSYKKWAHGLKRKGYASSPVYTQRLISVIEKHNLHIFDMI